jgi:hypothetical protein
MEEVGTRLVLLPDVLKVGARFDQFTTIIDEPHFASGENPYAIRENSPEDWRTAV